MKNQPCLIPLKVVLARTSIGKTRLYELIAAGKFPRPVHLGSRIAFADSEIDQWIESRMAERALK